MTNNLNFMDEADNIITYVEDGFKINNEYQRPVHKHYPHTAVIGGEALHNLHWGSFAIDFHIPTQYRVKMLQLLSGVK